MLPTAKEYWKNKPQKWKNGVIYWLAINIILPVTVSNALKYIDESYLQNHYTLWGTVLTMLILNTAGIIIFHKLRWYFRVMIMLNTIAPFMASISFITALPYLPLWIKTYWWLLVN